MYHLVSIAAGSRSEAIGFERVFKESFRFGENEGASFLGAESTRKLTAMEVLEVAHRNGDFLRIFRHFASGRLMQARSQTGGEVFGVAF